MQLRQLCDALRALLQALGHGGGVDTAATVGRRTRRTMLRQKVSGRGGACRGRKCWPGRSARLKKSGKRGATAMTGDPLASLCLKLVAQAPLSRYMLYLRQD